MGDIHLLDVTVANLIAAGEVVDRPASVVKELVENALDADADEIAVEIENGGKDLIRVKDNGVGLLQEDALLAFERHATSKVVTADDLDRIMTFGFRGEALASIAAVSRIELNTRRRGVEFGSHIVMEGGRVLKNEPVGCQEGFDIAIRELFFNTPGRRKFLKTNATELGHITTTMLKVALGHPDVKVTLHHNGKEILAAPIFRKAKDRLATVLGVDIAKKLIPVEMTGSNIVLTGFVSHPSIARRNRDYVHVFVNERPIRDPALVHAITNAYGGLLKDRSFPVAVLFLDLPPDEVDVNVHPQKLEVRFANVQGVYSFVRKAVKETLNDFGAAPGSLVEESSDLSDLPTNSMLQRTASPELPSELEPAVSRKQADTRPEPGDDPFRRLPWEIEAPPPSSGKQTMPVQRPTERQPASPARAEAREPLPNQSSLQLPDGESSLQKPASPDTDESDLHGALEVYAGFRTGHQWRVIGQYAETFILVQDGRDLLYIDQHVVQERLWYERFLGHIEERGQVASQGLLFPEMLRLNPQEKAAWQAHEKQLATLGFQVEPVDEASSAMVTLKGVPVFAEGLPERQFFLDVLDEVGADVGKLGNNPVERLLADVISTAACKASVKGFTALSHEEMEDVVSQLFRCKEPTHCPHGRPIVLRMSEKRLRAAFERG